MLKRTGFILVICFSLFVFKACDVINGVPDKDLIDKIDDQIAWSNAPRLDVTIDFPDDWGRSIHKGSGRVGEVRKGFPFNVEFWPDDDYAIIGWRAYRTEDLKQVPRWKENPDNYLYGIETVADVELPEVDKYGNGDEAYSITLNVEEPITLIPYSNEQPRITQIGWDTEVESRPRGARIRIQFAGNLRTFKTIDPVTNLEKSIGCWTFGENQINITGGTDADNHNNIFRFDGAGNQYVGYYYEEPDFENRWLTILPNASSPPPGDTLITLRLGTGIQTTGGKGLPADLIDSLYTFSWTTFKDVIQVLSWEAEYDGNNIIVKITYRGDRGSYPYAALYYNSSRNPPPNPETKYINTYEETEFVRGELIDTGFDDAIGNYDIYECALAFTPHSSFNGSHANGRGYNIQIALKADEEVMDTVDQLGAISSFQMFNAPGLKANHENTINIITSPAELRTINTAASADRSFVFDSATANFNTGEWTPVGTAAAPFKGKFYGMGTTFIVNSNINASDYAGLFGYTEGAEIQYTNVTYNNAQTFTNAHFGGIAGYAVNTTIVGSSVVFGTTISLVNTNTGNTDGIRGWGGVAGQTKGSTILESVSVSGTGALSVANSAAYTYLGGIAGMADDDTKIRNVSASINLSANVDGDSSNPHVGGIVGAMYGTGSKELSNVAYENGTITVSGTGSGNTCVGGIIGYSGVPVLIINAQSRTTNEITVTRNAELYVGGFGGAIQGSGTTIQSSFSVTPVNIQKPSANTNAVYAGGFIGRSYAANSSNYSTGSVTVGSATEQKQGTLYIGGFTGLSTGNIESSYASGNVTVFSTGSGNNHIGGFAGILESGASINNGYAIGNVAINSSASSELLAGGLVGYAVNGNVTKSFTKNSVTINGGSGQKIAGGITGHLLQGSISNSVAVGIENGDSIFVNGGEAYRIGSCSGGSLSGNYARANMLVNGAYSPDDAHRTADGGNGLNVLTSRLINGGYDFWSSTVSFAPPWNLGDLSGGHPLLGLNDPAPVVLNMQERDISTSISVTNNNLAAKGSINFEGGITNKAEVGETIVFNAAAVAGYTVTEVSAPAPASGMSAGRYSFEMPDSNVTIGLKVTADALKLTTLLLGHNTEAAVPSTYSITVTTPGDAPRTPAAYSSTPMDVQTDDEISILTAPATGDSLVNNTGVTVNISSVAISPTPDENELGPYTFTMPTSSATVTVNMKKRDYDLSREGTPQGTVEGGSFIITKVSGASTVAALTGNYNEEITITATPTSGWFVTGMSIYSNADPSTEIGSVTWGGQGLSNTGNDQVDPARNTGKFNVPHVPLGQTIMVRVTFAKVTYTTNPAFVGTTLESAEQTVTNEGTWKLSTPNSNPLQTGSTLTVTAAPAWGYRVKSVTMHDFTGAANKTVFETNSTSYNFTITAPSSGAVIYVTVQFEKKTYTTNPALNTNGTSNEQTVNPGGTWTLSRVGTAVQIGEKLRVNFTGFTPGYEVTHVYINGTNTELPTPINKSNIDKTTPDNYYEFEITSAMAEALDTTLGGVITVSNPTYRKRNYTITQATTVSNGSITSIESNNPGGVFQAGDTVTMVTVPNAGYRLTGISMTREDTSFDLTNISYNGNTVTFTMSATNLTAFAPTFSLKNYTITPLSGGTNGTFEIVTSNTSNTLHSTGSFTYTSTVYLKVEPASGYQIDTITILDSEGNTANRNWTTYSGTGIAGITRYNFQLNDLPHNEEVTVSVTFKLIEYDIDTSESYLNSNGGPYYITIKNPDGTIASGPTEVNPPLNIKPTIKVNVEQFIHISASAGYLLDSIYETQQDGNGYLRQDNNPFTLSTSRSFNINNYPRVKMEEVMSSKLTYTLSPGSASNGSISLSGTSIQVNGTAITINGSPDSGYRLASITVNGNPYTNSSATSNSMSFALTAADIPEELHNTAGTITVTPTFERKTVTIAAGTPANGEFTVRAVSLGAGKETGTTIYVDDISASGGYRIIQGTYTGAGISSGTFQIEGTSGSFTIPDGVTHLGTLTVSVTFARKTVTIAQGTPSNGEFTVRAASLGIKSTNDTIYVDDISPAAGYRIVEGTYSGAATGTFPITGSAATFTVPNGATDGGTLTVNVTFEKKTVTVAAGTPSNGEFTVLAASLGAGKETGTTVFVDSVSADDGYRIVEGTYSGAATGTFPISGTSGSFEIPDSVTHLGTLTVNVTFERKTVTIAKGIPSNGSFTLSQDGASVATAGTVSVTLVSADPGFRAVEGTYSGAATGTFPISGTSGSFEIPDSVTHLGTITVNVTFTIKTVTVVKGSPANGDFTFSQNNTSVATGGNVSVTGVTADAGYVIGNGTYNGAGVSDTFTITGTSGSFTVPAGVTDGGTLSVNVNFAPKTYTVLPAAGSRNVTFGASNVGEFTVSAVGGAQVNSTITVSTQNMTAGYTFGSMTVSTDDPNHATITPTGNTFTLPDLAHNTQITIAVTAAKINYPVTLKGTLANGSFSVTVNGGTAAPLNAVNDYVNAQVGDTVLITAVPATNYRTVSYTLSGGANQTVTGNSTTITMTAAAVDINVTGSTFSNVYTLTNNTLSTVTTARVTYNGNTQTEITKANPSATPPVPGGTASLAAGAEFVVRIDSIPDGTIVNIVTSPSIAMPTPGGSASQPTYTYSMPAGDTTVVVSFVAPGPSIVRGPSSTPVTTQPVRSLFSRRSPVSTSEASSQPVSTQVDSTPRVVRNGMPSDVQLIMNNEQLTINRTANPTSVVVRANSNEQLAITNEQDSQTTAEIIRDNPRSTEGANLGTNLVHELEHELNNAETVEMMTEDSGTRHGVPIAFVVMAMALYLGITIAMTVKGIRKRR